MDPFRNKTGADFGATTPHRTFAAPEPPSVLEPPNYIEQFKTAQSLLAEKLRVISTLPITSPEKDKLQEALRITNHWPLYFRSNDGAAKAIKLAGSTWSEEDCRALLCIVRNCYQLNLDTISQLFFPDRGAGAVLARYNPLLNSTKDYWDQADDEKILGLYQQQGEEFEKFAAVDFQGQFSAFDLEKAYGAAWRRKFTPTGNLKKPKPKKSEAGEKSTAGSGAADYVGKGKGKRRRTILKSLAMFESPSEPQYSFSCEPLQCPLMSK
jgi:hypothetical protein